jgi:hypothetical protein
MSQSSLLTNNSALPSYFMKHVIQLRSWFVEGERRVGTTAVPSIRLWPVGATTGSTASQQWRLQSFNDLRKLQNKQSKQAYMYLNHLNPRSFALSDCLFSFSIKTQSSVHIMQLKQVHPFVKKAISLRQQISGDCK